MFFLHLDKILYDYDLMHAEFICLQETRNTTIDMLLQFENNFLYFSANGLHGFVTLANKNTQIDKYEKYITNQFEAMLLTLHFANTTIHLANIHIAQMALLSDLLSFIQRSIITCLPSSKLHFCKRL